MPKSQRIMVTLSPALLEKLEEIRQVYGWSKSQTISTALAHYHPPYVKTGKESQDEQSID